MLTTVRYDDDVTAFHRIASHCFTLFPFFNRYIGRLHNSEVLSIDVSDVGCASGTAVKYQIITGYVQLAQIGMRHT